MIKYHRTEQQSYAIMVAHHMHYDNPPLYHTHIMEVPGFDIYSQQTLANQLTQQVSAIMVLLFLPHKVLESQLTSKKKRFVKWLNRELWLRTLYGNFMI